MSIELVVALCVLSFASGWGAAITTVHRSTVERVAEMRRDGYISYPTNPGEPEQKNEPWLDVAE